MQTPVVAFGPVMPGWGSWVWVGSDLSAELSRSCRTVCFQGGDIPECDVLVIVKHSLPAALVQQAARRSSVLYCPVDNYGSIDDLDADADMLRACSRIIVHCKDLIPFFQTYARTIYLDHHVKFAAPLREEFQSDGPFLWVGVRSNLLPLIDWVNAHPLPGELCVLTNLEDPSVIPSPADLGFRSPNVCIENWTPERQVHLTATARAALDIKGSDFRSWHKPPAKAIDFLASGVPLALNTGSSPARHLGALGFEIASPLDTEKWLSRAYWEETCRIGRRLREELTLERIGQRFRQLIDEVLAERRRS
jgi:hypothetical protein